MITLDDYFGPRRSHPEATDAMRANARELLGRVNALLDEARDAEVYKDWLCFPTESNISGVENHDYPEGYSGDGGFRASDSRTGGAGSKHRRACAVDVYDPADLLDGWITDEVLTRHGLYREHPSATRGWCHLQSLPPGSGKRTFYP